MLKRWLSTPKIFVRSGVALARFDAAGRRSRTTGRALRTNGRIRVRRIGAVSRAKGMIALLAVFNARTAGRRRSAVGASTFAYVWTLPSVVVVCRRAPGKSATARLMFASSDANARNTVAEVEI